VSVANGRLAAEARPDAGQLRRLGDRSSRSPDFFNSTTLPPLPSIASSRALGLEPLDERDVIVVGTLRLDRREATPRTPSSAHGNVRGGGIDVQRTAVGLVEARADSAR
jgi:hypothetical protein